MTTPGTLTVSRQIAAAPDRVFDAWLDPSSMRHWLFATPGGAMQTVEADPRPGGRFLVAEQRGEGLARHFGTYIDIERPRRLVFGFATSKDSALTIVTLRFEAIEAGTRITLSHDIAPEWASFADRARQGWTMILDALALTIVQPKENAMKLITYLAFDGRCEEAFRFYEKVLKGRIVMMFKCKDAPAGSEHPDPGMAEKIMHARLEVGGQTLMGGDAPPPHFSKPQGFSVNITLDDAKEAERIFAGLSEGATVKMPLQETFWAKRFGMLIDRYGTPWMVNCEKSM